jgi:hypothetical protein
MAEDFHRYEAMRDAGADPQAVYLAAKEAGLDGVTCIRLLRAVFSLPLREAVEVSDATESAAADRLASSLERHQGRSDAPSAAMMGNLSASDFQSMDQFPLKWRWTDPRWNELPPERLLRIRPLVASKAKEIHGRGMAFFHALKRRRDLFSHISEHDDSGSVGPETARQWLSGLPAAEGPAVLVYWDLGTAAVTDWATFCEYWDDFCYPMSDVIVWPITEEWALHYHHDERFTFGARWEDRWSPRDARGSN